MSKNATFFHSSFQPLPIFSTYRSLKRTGKASTTSKSDFPKVYRSSETGCQVTIDRNGLVIFYRHCDGQSIGTHLLTLGKVNFNRPWKHLFEYFDHKSLIQFFDGRLQIGEVYSSDLVSKFDPIAL